MSHLAAICRRRHWVPERVARVERLAPWMIDEADVAALEMVIWWVLEGREIAPRWTPYVFAARAVVAEEGPASDR